MKPTLFRSAVSLTDTSVDPGYLGLFAVMLLCLGIIPGAFILIGLRLWLVADHPLDLVGLAAVIAAACAGFGTAATGVGIFRKLDKTNNTTTKE
jgi:hypothetical protein